ncbi:MAG: DinB family protein, partial [bacterium]|nr:DinB family protein [bacterium]
MTRRFAAIGLLALPLAAGTVTQPDSDHLLAHLKKTEELLTGAVAGLSAEQWKFTSGEGRWSIAQCVEHLAISEDFLRETAGKVMESPPATSEQKKAVLGIEDKIAQMVPDRSRKFQAPPPLQPTSGESLEQVLQRFSASRAKTVAFVKANRDELRNHVGEHPVF